MLITFFFILGAFTGDYIALKAKGKFTAIIFMAMAVGFSAIAIPLAVASNPMQYPSITINTTSGSNAVIGAHNITSQPSSTTTGFLVGLLEANFIVQAMLLVVIVAYLFFGFMAAKKRRYNE
jgi:hypothetical protein